MTPRLKERETILKEIQTGVRHVAVYGFGNILAKAIGFVMLPFYTHYLTPADYGILEILDLSMSLFALLLNMGLTPSFLRCYAAAESPAEKRKVVSTACLFGVVTGLITFLLGLGLVQPASRLLFGPTVPALYVLLSFTSLILGYMANLPRTYLRALEASGTYTVVDTIQVLALLSLNIFFIALLKIGLIGVLWSSLIVSLFQCTLLMGWALRKTGFVFRMASVQRMLRFGLPLILSNVGLFVLNFSDRFFLQHLRSVDVVGIYAVGYKFGYMMNFLIVQPFFVMWQSRMYVIHKQPEHREIFKHVFALYWLILIYTGLAMSLFSPEVVRLMVEPKFGPSQAVIPVVVFAYVFYGLSYYAQLGMLLTDKTKVIGVIGAAAAVLNLGLNYFLILFFGMMGAAWATVFSFAFMAAVSYWCSQRVFRLPLDVGRMFAAMAVAGILYLLTHLWNPDLVVLVIGLKLLILVGFPMIVLKCGILPPGPASTLSAATQKAVRAIAGLVGMWPKAAVEGDR
jgi:O-antigen/teichoic acid export membrane protein